MQCLWCGAEFQARSTGGSRQRFCQPRHRVAFHTLARRWAEAMVESGTVTTAEMRAIVRRGNAALPPVRLAPLATPAASEGETAPQSSVHAVR